MSTEKEQHKKSQTRVRWVRWVVLGVILALVTFIGFMHQYPIFGWVPPGVDALCPFGGLESAWKFFTTGDMLTRITASAFILLVASLLVTVLFRRSFCGQICPLGTLQGFMAGLGKRIFGRKFTPPKLLDRWGKYLKYVILAGLLVWTWAAATLVIRPYDPWAAYMHLSSPEVFTEFLIGFILLVIGLGGSLFYDRFFCRYLCPMGAAYGLVSKFGITKIERNKDTCISCGACDKACPVDLKVSTSEKVTSMECLACNLCVTACPVKDTLVWKAPAKKTLHPLVITFGTLGIFVLVILLTTVTGIFALSPKSLAEENHTKAPVSVPAAAPAIAAPAPGTAAPVPPFDPNTIKGRHTFAEVSSLTQIPKEKMLAKFKISEEAFGKMIKEVVHNPATGVTMTDVKNYVAQELGIKDFVASE